MPTTQSTNSHPGAHRSRRLSKAPAIFSACPQRRGVCIRVFTLTPKKPNSALRKVARVRLDERLARSTPISRARDTTLQEHSVVLVRGGTRQGSARRPLSHRPRNVLDATGVEGRNRSRSKYGAKTTQVGFRSCRDPLRIAGRRG